MPNLFELCRAGVSVYPASGYRASSSGGLPNVGTSGYAWSSAPYSASGVGESNLYFFSSGAYPEGNDYRANGFPVRGKQE